MTVRDLDRMLHPDEARDIVARHLRRLETELIPLEDLHGRVLAEDLVADADLPPFRASTMDGYAVVHTDRERERRLLIGDGFAGDVSDVHVEPGTVAKIMTGAPVPDGATAVVQVEHTEQNGEQVRILEDDITEGQNIRPVGSDLRRGDVLVRAGSVLGPGEIGLHASLGRPAAKVGRRPRVAIFSTGDEIVDPDQKPGPGQIRDSNRFSLASAARESGAEIIMLRRLGDTIEELCGAFQEALDAADVIITSGGVSMGDRDLVKGLLGEIAEVHFRRVFMKPGKPLNFATAGDVLLFGLPGNPVSCLVSFRIFVRPALRYMQHDDDKPAELPVAVEHDVMPSDRIEFQRAIVRARPDGTLSAHTTGPQHSARLASWAGANALLIVQPGEERLPAGSQIPAFLLGPPLPVNEGQ